ncbi:hypothetical protein [Paenibacillus thiaminolyticus]|uniref:Right handed beta helix domain-containing protein n=1 Tax=Paenibacillus thiaminolyticus TaxID=49283 RepID=A0A3A3GKQ4_PANTH|nr:hypothetical protein [Paenibacillus thiaminolyticus]RJG23124.1 hypothetical protein DQX05_14720 [Paenibacillus thiaminolyticus]
MMTITRSGCGSKLRRGISAGWAILLFISVFATMGIAHAESRSVPAGEAADEVIVCGTASCLQSALKKVTPGQRIVLAPGTYTGSFSSDVNGIASQPIRMDSEDPANPAILSGYAVAAEHVDIKERTIGTVVENCTFYGEGISGANYADSFIDVKGNNAVIRNNIGYQNGNGHIADAFQVHQVISGLGINNEFSHNTLYLTDPSIYVIVAYGNATATAIQNIRTPAGNMYKGNVTVQ